MDRFLKICKTQVNTNKTIYLSMLYLCVLKAHLIFFYFSSIFLQNKLQWAQSVWASSQKCKVCRVCERRRHSPKSDPSQSHRGVPPCPNTQQKWRLAYCGSHCDSPPEIWGSWAVTPAQKHPPCPGWTRAGPQCQRRRGLSYRSRIKWVYFALVTENKNSRKKLSGGVGGA